MKKLAITSAILAPAFAICLSASPASAQATGTWVSGVGDDANPCSRTAPCKTFAGAISKTAINGEIRCLDPGGFGALTITKSISVDCHEIPAFSLNSFATCFSIALNTTLAADPLQTVRIRNVTCNGAGGSTRQGTRGVNITNAKAVFLEDMIISGNVNEGVRDARTASGTLSLRNVVVRDNTLNGISIVPTVPVAVVLDNVHSNNNAFGLAVNANGKVAVNNSVFMGNTSSGVRSDSGGQIELDNSTVSSNITGIDAAIGSTIRLYNNSIVLNNTGVSGATTSFGLNRIAPTVGTAPTAAGGASSGLGTQ
jgi:hypothetical protein